MRSAIQIYALVVCFASLMCLVIALGIGIYDVVQIAAPAFTVAYYQPHQSNEAFRQFYTDKKDLPDATITELREQALRDALVIERRNGTQSLVMALIVATIDVVLFGIHWRIARRMTPPP